MSDQQNEWWTTPGATPPAPGPPTGVDPDATVVVPARQAGTPPATGAPSAPPPGSQPSQYETEPPQYGSQPPQYGTQPPQYGSQPPQYGTQPPQYGTQPPHGGPQFVEPSQAGSRYRAPGGAITMILGSLLAIIGTFLPWVTFNGDSVNGYERYLIGDGFDAAEWNNPGGFVVVAMVIVIVSAVVVLAAGRRIATWIIALLAAGFGGLMSLAAFGAVGSVLDNDFTNSEFGIGVGILLCLLGATVAGVGAIIVAAKKR